MILFGLALGGCGPEEGPPVADGSDRDEPASSTPDDTGPPPDTDPPPDTGTEDGACGPDDPVLADQMFCAPDFTLPDHTGAPFTRSDLLGHVVIVEVVAMWCVPCRDMSTDVMEPLHERYHEQGLEIVSIVSEDVAGGDPTIADAASWRESLGLDYTVVADTGGDVAADWDRGGVVPMSYVIDRDGVVTWFANGRGTLEEFTREVELLLP